jgi:hypothetical protein
MEITNMKKIDLLKQKIEAANEKISKLKQEMATELRSEFHNSLKELFDEYPFVNSVSFTAFQPFFNDGDTCEYSVNHEYCQFNGYDEDDDEQEGENVDVLKLSRKTIYVEEPNPDYDPSNREWGGSHYSKTRWVKKPNPDFNPLYKEAVDAFREALKVVDDDNWMDMVGDHVKVIITRDGIETDKYDHD